MLKGVKGQKCNLFTEKTNILEHKCIILLNFR